MHEFNVKPKKSKKQIVIVLSICFVILSVLGAYLIYKNNNTDGSSTTDDLIIGEVDATDTEEEETSNGENHESTDDYTVDTSSVVAITLKNNAITINGDGASASGNVLTISSAGTYSLSGTLNNGQIIIDTDDEESVKLILNGVNITCSNSAGIYVKDASKTIILLAENTKNYITDGSSYVFEDATNEEPSAAIFSEDDLTIYGEGSLTVDGNYADGITSEDGLIIASGNISVTAIDDGIRGKNYLIIEDGGITVDAGSNGLKSDNEDNALLGYISITNGTFDITSDGDAIAAQTDVLITDGTFTLTCGGGGDKTISDNESAKGIKAVSQIVIDNGTFDINTADDALHSDGTLTINNGTFEIYSGDDGIHAESKITIVAGTINISQSYEGIESAQIYISGGNIHLQADDDGINIAGGNDSSAMGGRPGQNSTYNDTGEYFLSISGGYIFVDAAGDGIDVNGSAQMTDGTLIVNGPTSDGNGPLDYDGTFNISGGYLIAVGSSGMAMAPSTSSTQYSALINLSSVQKAGTLIHIESSDGTEIATFKSTKNYQSVTISSSEITKGTKYNVYIGGSSTGTVTDGLYDNGTYSGGTLYTSFTPSSVVTKVGSSTRNGF